MNIESRTAVRLGMTGLIIYAGYFAIDQGAKPVYGNGPVLPTSTAGFSPTPEKYTPTATRTIVTTLPTSTRTPTRSITLTPDSKVTQIPAGLPTETVTPTKTVTSTPTQTGLQEARKTLIAEQTKTAEETEIAKIQAEINRLRGTPTETSTPTRTATPAATHTPTATSTPLPGDVITMKRDDFNKFLEQAVKIAVEAKVQATPTATRVATPITRVENRGGGEFPWLWMCLVGPGSWLIGAGVAGYIMRRRIMDFIRQRLAPQQPAAPEQPAEPQPVAPAGGAPLEDDLAEE